MNDAKPLVSSAVGTVERHRLVRLTGASQRGGTPDLAASRFMTGAGFIPEKGRDSDLAYLGAKPQAGDFFLDLALAPGKTKHGSFKLVQVQVGGETVLESGVIFDLDKTSQYVIMSGNGQVLIQTQIVADLALAEKNGSNGQAAAPLVADLALAEKNGSNGQAAAPPPPSSPPVPVSAPAQTATAQDEVELRVDQIEPWPDQPRKLFREKPLAELADSMSGFTQVQAIMVRPFKEGEARNNPQSTHLIIDGERRWRGAKNKHRTKIKVKIVYPKDIVEQHRMSVISNMNHEDHTHYEYARAVIFQYDHGRTPKEIAFDFSKKPGWIYNYLALKNLRPELFELLNPAVGEDRRLPFNHARILARVRTDVQVAVLEQAKREGKPYGPRGILFRLRELAEENLSEFGQSGRKICHDHGNTARTVNRAIAAVGFNARVIREMAVKFKISPAMADPAVRTAVIQQVKAAAEALSAFSLQITS